MLIYERKKKGNKVIVVNSVEGKEYKSVSNPKLSSNGENYAYYGILENGNIELILDSKIIDIDFKEIITFGYSNDDKKITLIGEKEDGNFELLSYKKSNNSWRKYDIYKGNLPLDTVYSEFEKNDFYKNTISILIRDSKGKYKNVFDGYIIEQNQEYSSILIYKLYNEISYLNIYGGKGIKYTSFSAIGDGPSEDIGIGLLDFKKNGYARYYNGTYKLYNYGNSTPIHSAYKGKNEITGKEFIVLDGVKGKEYDRVWFNPKYLFDTGTLAYYSYIGDTWYYIEHSCN